MVAASSPPRWLGDGAELPVSNRIFFYPDYRRYVLFTANVLDYMYAHAQRRFWQKEAGGEIYVINPDAHGLLITAATGPNPGDLRRRHSFNPDIKAATRDREQQFTLGRHAIGLWHTHPEPKPTPSSRDHRTTAKYLDAFGNDRNRYLMVILGDRGDPLNITVWSAGQNSWSRWTKLLEANKDNPSEI